MSALINSSSAFCLNPVASRSVAAVASVIANADSECALADQKLLIQFLYAQCLREIPQAEFLKPPELSNDAGILKIGKYCVKFHTNTWQIADVNYRDPATIEYINRSGIAAPVLARDYAECSADRQAYVVVAYEYIEGRTISDLLGMPRDASFTPVQMNVFRQLIQSLQTRADDLGCMLMAAPGDYVIEASGKVTLTDWNKIRIKFCQ